MSWNTFYVLDILAMLFFVFSYYRNCYRRGYRIDFWHAQLFLIIVLPNLIMLPFTRNELNGIVLHQDFAAVVTAVPTVFLVTLLGFLAGTEPACLHMATLPLVFAISSSGSCSKGFATDHDG
jgi:hypothetical protein